MNRSDLLPLTEGGTYIIAEAGSNHMGSLDRAMEHVEIASACGADAVKFQLFRMEDILVDPTKGDQATLLPVEWIPKLHAECALLKIQFLCTPFSAWAVDILRPFVPLWKVGSFEHKRRDVLDIIEKTGMPVIASCGRGRPEIANPHWLLYCVSEYPAPLESVHLPIFGIDYDGISDHTTSTVIPALAVARGARVVEKHFRTDSTPYGSPDYPHSLDPRGLSEMIDNIRLAEAACSMEPVTSPEPCLYPNRRE